MAMSTKRPIRASGQPITHSMSETNVTHTVTGNDHVSRTKTPMLHTPNARAATSQRTPTTRIPTSPMLIELASGVVL